VIYFSDGLELCSAGEKEKQVSRAVDLYIKGLDLLLEDYESCGEKRSLNAFKTNLEKLMFKCEEELKHKGDFDKYEKRALWNAYDYLASNNGFSCHEGQKSFITKLNRSEDIGDLDDEISRYIGRDAAYYFSLGDFKSYMERGLSREEYLKQEPIKKCKPNKKVRIEVPSSSAEGKTMNKKGKSTLSLEDGILRL